MFNNLHIIILSVLAIGLNACSNVEYMDRKSYTKYKGEESNIRMKRYSDGYKPARDYGGLKIGRDLDSTANLNKEDKNYYLSLKRNRQKIFAQALLLENTRHSAWFDETLVDFGVDKKDRTFNVGLTLKY